MRRLLWTTVVFGSCVGSLVMAVMEAGGSDPADERIAELIRRLGDDSYSARETASKRLLEEGEAALPALTDASKRGDLEIRLRARRLISALLLESRSTKMSLVLVPRGEFAMGSPPSEIDRQPDERQHRVTISNAFLLGECEVTQDEYQIVMRSNPGRFKTQSDEPTRTNPEGSGRFPVESVSWFDAIDFCNRLSALDGFAPYYRLDDVERANDSIARAKVSILGGNGYRLPTEAEWEYACRASTTTRFYFGDRNSGSEANVKPAIVTGGYGGTSPQFKHLGRTAKVRSYPANSFGLYELHGNVAEWCWDRYDREYYANSPATDPQGPDAGMHRVIRGGSWMVLEGNCRAASRFWLAPDERKDHVGFRVARTPRLKSSS